MLLFAYTLFLSVSIGIVSKVYLERVMMQIKLNEQGQNISKILQDLENKAEEWLWEIDDGGIITAVSEKLCHITGKARNELIGLHCIKVLTDTFIQVEKMIADKNNAEFASRMKSQFVANVSHEIRTPLNAMMGFLQLLLITDVTDEQRDYLFRLQESSGKLKHIIDDILDISKIEVGKMEIEEIPFNLKKAVTDSVSLFESLAKEKGLDFSLSIDQYVLEAVMGDPIRINQILNNLLSNAVKFTSEGKIDVTVRLWGQNETSFCVEFIIRDTGIGMDRETVDRLCQPFTQADHSTTRKYGGTGLGLSITYNLVKIMNGSFSVTSNPGEGSCFDIKIIVKKRFDGQSAAANPKNRVSEPYSKLLKMHLNILVVEDNSLNMLFLVTALRKLNMVCDEAGNGRVAVEKAGANHYDLILMDCQLPVIDGYTAAETIRKFDAPHCDVPIIALTANATKEDRIRCLKSGMDDYLAKPIDLEDLRRKIVQFIAPSSRISFDIVENYSKSVDLLISELHFTADEAKYLLREFVASVPEFFQKLDAASGASQSAEVVALAHQMKGVCCNLRLHQLQTATAALETAAKDGSTDLSAQIGALKTLLLQYSEGERMADL